MPKVVFTGDVHSRIDEYERLIRRHSCPTIQVGDMDIGFRNNTTKNFRDNDFWIHGNHDHLDQCVKEKGFLGRYGVTPEGVFYMSGAFSADSFYLKPGVNWWHTEQLNIEEMNDAVELYRETKPEIVCTHDCPRSLYPLMLQKIGKPDGPLFENSTANCLEKMFQIHQPSVHVYGHWHTSVDEMVGDTRFVCLNILESISLEW